MTPFGLYANRDAPWVLVILRDEAITPYQPELRQLGVMVLAVSSTGVWSFDPDTEVELVAPANAPIDRELGEIAARAGVPAGHDAVFVIDGDGSVRFAHDTRRPLGPSLHLAIAEASSELESRAERHESRGDLLLASLCTGFAVGMLGKTP